MIRLRPMALAAAAGLLAAAAPAMAQEPDLDGTYWKTDDGKFVFRLSPCGEELCGDLVWLLRILDKDTRAPKLDKGNPDPALRGRPMCGLRLVSGLEVERRNSWEDGHFYNPDDGSSYSVRMKYDPDDSELSMRVFLGIEMFGKTMRLYQVGAPTETCDARAQAALADIDNYFAKTPGSPWVYGDGDDED